MVFGDGKRAPAVHEVLDLLAPPGTQVAVNMLGLEVQDRPGFFAELMPQLATMRSGTGRPHWILIDEAHHLLPARSEAAAVALPKTLPATIYVTVHPDQMSPEALAGVDVVLAVGERADEVVGSFCEALGIDPPPLPDSRAPATARSCSGIAPCGAPLLVEPISPRQAHKRHTRKYAEGTLGEDKSFYFRGPEEALNLRAQNLMMFLQIADGVDDATWLHHLRRGDYARWFRTAIKDDELADEVAEHRGPTMPPPAAPRCARR